MMPASCRPTARVWWAAWYDEDYDGKNDSDTSDDRIDTDDRDKTEQGVEGLRVILTQYYFVPTYDNHGNQLLEDEDNNVFYLDTEHATDDYPNGVLRLVENRGKNVVEGDGGKVYLVRFRPHLRLRRLVQGRRARAEGLRLLG